MTILAPLISAPPLILDALVQCVCTELEATGAGPTCWCGMQPGSIPSWDYCGECDGDKCGMGYVRLASMFPYDIFPNPVLDLRCAHPLGMAIEVGALRCMPTTHDGLLADSDVMQAVAFDQASDAIALWRAITCCDVEMAVQAYTPVGPGGGCVGGYWTAFCPLD